MWMAVPAAAQVPPAPPTPRTPDTPRTPRTPRVMEREHARFDEVERRSLVVPRVTELDLSNIAGDFVIVQGSGRDAAIEAVKHGYGDTQEEAREQLQQTEVDLTVTDAGRGVVRVRHMQRDRHARRGNIRAAVDFKVTAPAGTHIRVKSISGDIQATRIKADLALETISGDIHIESAGRVSLAKTVSGDVTINGASGGDPLIASSVSGNVRLQSLKAPYIDLNSVSGDVVARDVTCERAELQTLSGDVEYSGALTRAGRYELKAHSGNIRLAPSNDVGFNLEAQSFSGRIKSLLPIKNEAASEDEDEIVAGGVRVRLPKREYFRGTFKDGSATVELTTFSGNIIIGK